LKANFLAVAKGQLTTHCRAQRAGRSLIFAEGEVLDLGGELLAKGSGTFKLLHPASGKERA
jgi:acyl-coenzyme A thioesterase PaaI-like protein